MQVYDKQWHPHVMFSSDAPGKWGCGAIWHVEIDSVYMAVSLARKQYCSERTITHHLSMHYNYGVHC